MIPVTYNCEGQALPPGLTYKIENNNVTAVVFDLRDKELEKFIKHISKLIQKYKEDK